MPTLHGFASFAPLRWAELLQNNIVALVFLHAGRSPALQKNVHPYKISHHFSLPYSKGTFIGELAFEVDMETVYKLIQDVTGLGETGETLIGKRVDGDVIYLHPLRHDPAAALYQSYPNGEKDN